MIDVLIATIGVFLGMLLSDLARRYNFFSLATETIGALNGVRALLLKLRPISANEYLKHFKEGHYAVASNGRMMFFVTRQNDNLIYFDKGEAVVIDNQELERLEISPLIPRLRDINFQIKKIDTLLNLQE
jgi:hypothetical protein